MNRFIPPLFLPNRTHPACMLNLKKTLHALLFGLSFIGFTHLSMADTVNEGEYLTKAAGCITCHTDSRDHPFAGGKEFATPLGNFYSTNITPDPQTGIGLWSDEEFYRALHHGIGREGNLLYPIMPYYVYTALSYDDAIKIKNYLFEQPTIQQENRPHQLQFPYNQRAFIHIWKKLNFHEATQNTNFFDMESLVRGAYLGEVLIHCSGCHTPTNITMAPDSARLFEGSPATGGWYAPNITPDQLRGVGKLSEQELQQFLKTGAIQGKAYASGPMADMIETSLSHLTDDDISSLVIWLKNIPFDGRRQSSSDKSRFEWGKERYFSVAQTSQKELLENLKHEVIDLKTLEDGAQIYRVACASCHGLNGNGIMEDEGMPKLRGNSSLGISSPNNVALPILFGVDRKFKAEHIVMPAFSDQLTDTQISLLTNWLFQEFGRPTTQITAEGVNKLRRNQPDGDAPLKSIVRSGGVALMAILFIIMLSLAVRFSPRIKTKIKKAYLSYRNSHQ